MSGVADGKRYSPLDRESVHADMRIDPAATRRNVARQPGVAAAHRDCATCRELDPVTAWAHSRRAKVAVSMAELAELLGLPPHARPQRMFVSDDPQFLFLVFESDELEEVPLDVEAPFVELVERPARSA